MFVSPHKLPGGVGAPGLLLAKRALFHNAVPTEPGGGTVFFVTDQDHRCVPSSVLSVTIAPPLWDLSPRLRASPNASRWAYTDWAGIAALSWPLAEAGPSTHRRRMRVAGT